MIRYFSNHPTAANLIMVALLVLGLSSVSSMKRETFPSIKSSKVSVSVVYRGATAKEVEDAICRRLEDAIEDVNDLDEVRCEAREGNAKLTAIMLEGAQMSRFVNDIKSEVDTINDQPAQAEAPITTELGLSERVISIAVTGFEDARELREYVNAFKDRLAALSEVSSVAVRGFSVRQLLVSIPAWRLRQFGLSVADIANVIEPHSVSQPVGSLEGQIENAIVRFDTRAKSIDALDTIPIVTNANGAEITLGEIATIADRFELAESKVLFDGQRAGFARYQQDHRS